MIFFYISQQNPPCKIKNCKIFVNLVKVVSLWFVFLNSWFDHLLGKLWYYII